MNGDFCSAWTIRPLRLEGVISNIFCPAGGSRDLQSVPQSFTSRYQGFPIAVSFETKSFDLEASKHLFKSGMQAIEITLRSDKN
jgi:hypothetical protein